MIDLMFSSISFSVKKTVDFIRFLVNIFYIKQKKAGTISILTVPAPHTTHLFIQYFHSVLFRRHFLEFLEHTAKVGRIFKSHQLCDLSYL